MTTTVELPPHPDLLPTYNGPDHLIIEAVGETFTYMHGRAVPYGTPGRVGLYDEVIAYGALTESLADDHGHTRTLPLLAFHDAQSMPIGKAVTWREERDGLYGTWQIADHAVAQEAARAARDEYLTGLSIGFVPLRTRWQYAQDWDYDAGRVDLATVTEARLLEVSLTPVPAYLQAIVLDVESEPATPAARSALRRERFRHRQRVELRQIDREAAEQAASRAERDRWRRYLEAVRRR